MSVRCSSVNAFVAIATIACFFVAVGVVAFCAPQGQVGATVVQSILNEGVRSDICAPGPALGASTFTVVATFFIAALLCPFESASHSHGTVFAVAIRPPPAA